MHTATTTPARKITPGTMRAEVRRTVREEWGVEPVFVGRVTRHVQPRTGYVSHGLHFDVPAPSGQVRAAHASLGAGRPGRQVLRVGILAGGRV